MIDLVKKFFDRNKEDSSGENKSKRPHDIRMATCALFLEMANIDDEFTDSEREHIITILKNNYNLPDDDVTSLIEATEEELKESIDLWRFTTLINKNYSPEEKIQIIEMVWKIAFADGTLDKHEDYLVHKMANLLRLRHKQLIEAKLKIIHDERK